MSRRRFIVYAGAVLAVAKPALAQPTRLARVGYVAPSPGPTPVTEAFRRGLAEHGYIEGRALLIEYRWMAGREADYEAVLTSLAGHVDVALVFADVAIAAARRLAETTPVVFVNAADPVGLGVVQSLARPGRNMTGLSHVEPELIVKRLEVLKQVLPRAVRFAVIAHPGNASSKLVLQELDVTARTLGVALARFDAGKPEDFDTLVPRIARDGFAGVVVVDDAMFFVHRAKIVELLGRHRLPAVYPFRQFVEAGGLLSYSANLPDLVVRAAGYVARILKGERPGNLPVERPTRFELVVNARTARELALTIPPSVLLRADQVIE